MQLMFIINNCWGWSTFQKGERLMNIYKMFYLIVLCLLITGCSNKNNDIVLLEKTIEDIKSDNIQLHELNTELSKKYKQSESKRKEYSEDLKESLMKVEELDNII